MQDAALVGVVDGPRHRGHQPRQAPLALPRLFRGLPRGESPVLPALRQAAAFHQFHAEVMPALMFADFVDWHNVRMIEVGSRLGFLAKALDLGGGG